MVLPLRCSHPVLPEQRCACLESGCGGRGTSGFAPRLQHRREASLDAPPNAGAPSGAVRGDERDETLGESVAGGAEDGHAAGQLAEDADIRRCAIPPTPHPTLRQPAARCGCRSMAAHSAAAIPEGVPGIPEHDCRCRRWGGGRPATGVRQEARGGLRRARRHVQHAMEQALKPRQADVLRQLYGLDGREPRRPSEVARAVGVTRARIGQVLPPVPPLPPGADRAAAKGCTTPAAANVQAACRFRSAGWRCWRPVLVSKLWPRG